MGTICISKPINEDNAHSENQDHAIRQSTRSKNQYIQNPSMLSAEPSFIVNPPQNSNKSNQQVNLQQSFQQSFRNSVDIVRIQKTLGQNLSKMITKENLIELAGKKRIVEWNVMIYILEKFISNSNSDLNLLSNDLLIWLIDKFELYSLDKDQKLEFISTIKKYFNINSEDDKKDLQKPFQHLASRFQKLELQLYFQQKSCTDYVTFIPSRKEQITSSSNSKELRFFELNFDLTQKGIEETKRVAAKVRNLCHYDMRAFSFMSLYLLKSVQICLNTLSYRQVQSMLKQRVNFLKQKFGVKPAQSNVKSKQGFQLVNIVLEMQIKKFDMDQLEIKEGKIKELIDWIHEKIDQAVLDFNEFKKLKNFLSNGFNFKACLKIKDKQQQFSIMRTVEKLLEDYIQEKEKVKDEKYKKEYEKLKKNIEDFYVQKNQKNSFILSHELIKFELNQISDFISQILSKHKSIKWNIKDLLRGKCTFNSKEDIIEAVEKLVGITKDEKKIGGYSKNTSQKSIWKKEKNDLFDFNSKSIEQIIAQNRSESQQINLDTKPKDLSQSQEIKLKKTYSYQVDQNGEKEYKKQDPQNFDSFFFESQQSAQIQNLDLFKKFKPTFKTGSQVKSSALIQKLSKHSNEELNKGKYEIIQVKDRLKIPSCQDYVIIFRMQNGTIAELQLTLNQNSFAANFDHQFYELTRSKLFTPIANLYLNHNKWSSDFFDQLIENFEVMCEGNSMIDNRTSLFQYAQDMTKFETQFRRFKEQKKKRTKDSNQKQKEHEIKNIQERFDKVFNQKRTELKNNYRIPRNEEQQLQNQLQFLLAWKDYKKAQEKLKYLDKNVVISNRKIRQSYADILLEKIMYEEIQKQLRQKLIKVCQIHYQELEKQYSTESFKKQRCQIYRKLGKLFINIKQFQVAKDYISKALMLREQIDKNESQKAKIDEKVESKQYAEILLEMGHVYHCMGDYENAEKLYYNRSKEIYQKHNQADSPCLAQVFLLKAKNQIKLMNTLKSNKDSINTLLGCSLEIFQKRKGPHSIEVAQVLYEKGIFAIEKKNWEEAEQEAKKSYEIYAHLFGKNDQRTIRSLYLMEEIQLFIDLNV